MAILNGIPMPGVTSQDPVGESNLLYSTTGLRKAGFTFAKDADGGANSDGIIAAGTVVGRITTGKKLGIYDDDDTTTGVGTAVGILLDDIDVSAADALCNVAYGGVFIKAAVTGMDANGLADLNGRETIIGDTAVYIF